MLFGPQSQFDPISPFAKVLAIDVKLTHDDPFGAVSAGSITLLGPVLRLGTARSFKEAKPPAPYPKLMGEISVFLEDLPGEGYGEDADAKQVCLLMLLRWREAGAEAERVCFLVLLGVDGEDSWRRITCLVLKTKEMAGVDETTTGKSREILKEIRGNMRRETVRIT